MPIIIATILILTISFTVRLLNKAMPFKICSVCAGVSLTWFLISVGIVTGLLESDSWKLIIAIAMGGTAAGVAFQAEKKFGWHNPMMKLSVIIIGFILAYFAVSDISLWILISEAAIILVLGYSFFLFKIGRNVDVADPKKIKELEEKMKDCC